MSTPIVNKDIIVQRSAKYGNNFPDFAILWNTYFKVKYGMQFQITPADAAMLMCLHKISRLMNAPEDQDTLQDMINYAWLGIDYDLYVEQLNKRMKLNQHSDNTITLSHPEMYCFKTNSTCELFNIDGQPSNRECVYNYDWQNCDWKEPITIN